jgi:RES domain-containing protein
MNLDGVGSLPSRPIANTWYRYVETAYFKSPLDYLYTKRYPSRYSAGLSQPNPFAVVYVADHPTTAAFEVGQQFGDPLKPGGSVPNPANSYVILNVEVQLRYVVDLSDVDKAHAPLGTTAQELTGDWRGYRDRNPHTPARGPVGIAPTQELGAALFGNGRFEGFLAISAKRPCQLVLGVFPERMQNGSFLKFVFTDADGPHEFCVP